jgi:3-phenylpropionate/trans-cinnamate dioxygenase ferredoxin reductase subunit
MRRSIFHVEKTMDGIVIIGAGECGTRAAFALREAGYRGSVTLVGAEPHLPYERPPLSKPMNGAVQMKLICAKDALEAAGIDYLPGVSASKLDAGAGTVTLSDGRVLRYEKLLLATGARPRRLGCPGAERALDFRTHADAETVFSNVAAGQSVAIIGGGLIGMELAAVLRGKNVSVDVIEAAPKPLGRAVPARFAEKLHARHAAEGVRFHLGRGVVAVGDEGVTLTDGTLVPADLVVGAIGVLPETALAEAAGLAVDNGILTDSRLRTSVPNVFAAGDCAAVAQPAGGHIRHESWRNARAQAETAARNIAGAAETFAAIPWFWSDQYDLGLQVAGLPRPAHQSVVRPVADGELAFYLDDGRLAAAAGLGIGNSLAKEIKLAEMLIAAGISPSPAALADPGVNLKVLLKSARAA